MARLKKIQKESSRDLMLRVLDKAMAAVDTAGATGITGAQDFVFLGGHVLT